MHHKSRTPRIIGHKDFDILRVQLVHYFPQAFKPTRQSFEEIKL